MLAPRREDRRFGTKSSQSANESRDDFKRDRDRILYSVPFRRLAGVTQVISPRDEQQVFHNRLTHTIKVAQVGRRIAEKIKQLSQDAEINPEVVEAAALAHDLGHPPFGHISEQVLDENLRIPTWLKGHNPSDFVNPQGFEGNPQSFRIVTVLAPHKKNQSGLDLTRATLRAILKYPWIRSNTPSAKQYRKWGAYESEKGFLDFALELYPPLSGQMPSQSLEAAAMDWADDIAYAVHDVEDFFRAGFIPLDRIAIDDSEVEDFFDWVYKERWKINEKESETNGQRKKEYPGFTKNEAQDAFKQIRLLLRQVFETPLRKNGNKRKIRVQKPYEGTLDDEIKIRRLASLLTARYIEGTYKKESDFQSSFLIKNSQIEIHPPFKIEVAVLKQLVWRYVIYNESLREQQYMQRKVINSLFEIYANAIFSNPPNFELFPPRFHEAVNSEEGNAEKIRIVADFISGMTDQQAMQMYRLLNGMAD